MNNDIFSQSPFRCKLDWGIPGTLRAAARGDVIVVVDTLSFSTTTAYAVSRGAIIYPCGVNESPLALADNVGGTAAVRRNDVPSKGRYSLSPTTLQTVIPGEKIIMPSLNGSNCSRLGAPAGCLLLGALVNASTVAAYITRMLQEIDLCVTCIACGEREPEPPPNGDLRMAIEDYLAAGAIISKLQYSKSPEAELCEIAFLQAEARIEELLWECTSGQELRMSGFGEDVRFASRIDSVSSIPVLRDGAFRDY